MPKAEVYQPVAGIGDRGSSCVGDERNFGSLFQLDDQFRRLSNLIVFVITDHPLLNFEVRKKLQCLARVFASNRVHFLQHAQRAQRNVFQVSNRSSDYI